MNSHEEEQENDHLLELTLTTEPQPDPPIPSGQPDPCLSSTPVAVHDYTSQLLMQLLKPQSPRPEIFLPRPNPNPKKSSNGQILSSRPLAVRKRRSNAKRGLRPDKSPTVNPPYRWATDRRAVVHSLEELESQGIETVLGDVRCKKCEETFEVGYDLKAKFSKLRSFVAEKKDSLMDRSAPEWNTPAWVDCTHCGQKKCAKGVVAEKKRNVNWLFLFLGGFLCNCTLQQLKYFCKHTGNHRTGAKNRLLYLTYLGLCKQLDPSGPFDPPCL